MSPYKPWAYGLDEIRLRPGEGFGVEALAELLENVPVAIAVTLGSDHRYAFGNRLFRSVWSNGESVIGRTVSDVMGAGYTPHIHSLRQQVYETGQPCELTGAPIIHQYVQEATFCDIKLLPVRLSDDRIGGVLTIAANVTERVKARREADRQAQEAELFNERLALAVEATELGLWEWDAQTGRTYWSDRQKEIFGLPKAEPVTYEQWIEALHPDDRGRVIGHVSSLLSPQSGGQLRLEHRIVRPDGEVRWIISRGKMHYEIQSGELMPARLLGTIFDITDRRRNEEARQILVQELDHRVKNLFAMAGGLVALTARTSETPKQMAAALKGRLDALARAHELIRPAIAGDEPSMRSAEITEILRAVLAPHGYDDAHPRMTLEGPSVLVGAKAATAMTLVLHELATNASKYGSLSVHDGSLRVLWAQDDAALRLTWREDDGPPIQGPPLTEGFGSQLAHMSVTGQLAGEIVRDWRREGLEVRIRLPLEHIA